jgi:cellulose synthase (UDP-forming)
MPARNHDGAGPFWCGSTSLIRIKALQQIGGISTATIVEDMHTTLGLIRAGWKTAYHHQILAVGLAPTTPDQYLLQRRRWGMGSMQVLVRERLWAAKRWLSWRNYYEYLGGTLWWLEGIGTLGAFTIPAVVLVSGAQVSTANPVTFAVVFLAMFLVRMWGVKRLFRMHLHWPTSFALRILRVPVGISCLWWLVSRKSLKFQVTPKAGADDRIRGRAPWILWVLLGITAAAVVYATAGLLGLVPWQGTASSTIASGIWLVLAGLVLVLGTQRIRAAEFASSRRNAYRVPLRADVSVNGVPGELLDISVGGAAVRLPAGMRTELSVVELGLPGADPFPMERVRVAAGPDGRDTVSLRLMAGDWTAYRRISLWLFHTPPGVIEGIPLNAPAVAATSSPRRSRIPVLARQYG